MLKKLICLNADDLALYAGIECGLFLLIQIGIACVMYFGKESSAPLICGTVMPVAAVLAVLIATMVHVSFSFDLAVRFGRTRRRALGLAAGLALFQSLFALAVAAGLAGLERLFAPGLWMNLAGRSRVVMGGIPPIPEPGLAPAGGAWLAAQADTLYIEPFSLAWWWYPVLLAAGMAAGLILGALLQRFGSKGGWILWAAFVLPCLGVQLLPWELFRGAGWLIPLITALAAAGVVWSVWSLLHTAVRQ